MKKLFMPGEIHLKGWKGQLGPLDDGIAKVGQV